MAQVCSHPGATDENLIPPTTRFGDTCRALSGRSVSPSSPLWFSPQQNASWSAFRAQVLSRPVVTSTQSSSTTTFVGALPDPPVVPPPSWPTPPRPQQIMPAVASPHRCWPQPPLIESSFGRETSTGVPLV